MASNNSIVKKSIQIDAGDTVRTVRSLKQEISDLRDQLLNLEQGTEEYDAVQKQLTEDVEDLNTVMGAHKDKAEVLEGSYNDLQNQLKELKKAWKETNDEADRDVLGQKINELNNQLKEMDASIGDFHRNVGNYQSAWQGLSGVMDKSEKVTDDLEKGIRAFGTAMGLTDKQVKSLSDGLKRLKDAFKIAKDITKAQEETKKLNEVQQATTTTTTALAAAEKSAAAQGTVLATSQKATGAAAKTMAAGETTATVATKGLSVAMKGLKAALISTGIGALIVLLGELAANFDVVYDKAVKILNLQKASAKDDTEELKQRAKEQKEARELEEEGLEFERRKAEARGATQKELLEMEVEHTKRLKEEAEKQLEGQQEYVNKTKEQVEELEGLASKKAKWYDFFYPIIGATKNAKAFFNKKQLDELKNELQEQEGVVEDTTSAIEGYDKALRKLDQDIEIQKIKDANKALEKTVDELRKWKDLVQDPKFSKAWHDLFNIEFTGANPSDVLKQKMDAAVALVQQFKGDTSEVEQYFKQLISEADAAWESLVQKENQILDEGMAPVDRLKKEMDEWVAKANEWGFNAVEITRYYENKIQQAIDDAEAERKAKEEAAAKEAEAERIKALEEQLSQIDAMLATQEKMDALFNPMFIQDTAAGDIEQDIEAVQRLYDTQMEYLNGLLESADLTEEAYAGIEERILSLTIAFNSQMNVLKKEQDYQGKNFSILTRKQVANFNLMETAASEFSNTFQSLGLENSVAFKGFATAQALISAILAANRVLAEQPGEMWAKIAAAAATLTAGLANVAAIWMVNPDGSNAGGAMNTSMQSATPVIGNSQPINYVSNVTNAEEEDRLNQPLFVKVTDIMDGINDHNVQVTNSSF